MCDNATELVGWQRPGGYAEYFLTQASTGQFESDPAFFSRFEREEEIGKALSKKGSGAFQIPGLCKIIRVNKPAQAAKKGVPNPFKPGELMDVAAKPAKNVVKVRALKNLKSMV